MTDKQRDHATMAKLVVRFRHLPPVAARAKANVGIKRTTSNHLFLVELLNLTFEHGSSCNQDSNVKFAPLGAGGAPSLPHQLERPSSGRIIKLEKGASILDVKALGNLSLTLQQDADNFPAVQRGLRASGKGGVLQLSRYQESRIQHYHQTIDKYLEAE